MTGYYFHNMDARSTRAHACQIFSTVAAIDPDLSLSIVLPRYQPTVDMNMVKENHGLSVIPQTVFLWNFGIQKSGIAAFVLFNLPAALFIIKKKITGDINFLYFRTSYFLPLAVMVRLLRIPFFYETHRKPISWSERCRDYAMCSLAAGLVVISDYMRGYYIRYGKDVLVAHDAVSLARFTSLIGGGNEARKKLNLPLNQNICVYAGTISKLKGVETVITAAHRLPETVFVFVGPVSTEFAGRTLPLNIKLLARVEQKDLPEILRAGHVLLLPHPRGEYSQSPMKLFEYMASGIPIVASRLPSISEVLNDKNAILVEPENGEALARGIERAISDIHLSQTLAQKAYSDVQNYTWEKRGRVIAEFIKNHL